MPRPKKGQGEPGVDRLRDAFWALLARKPYASMTVADILRETGLNKNAFYYHYANLDELAEKAVEETLPVPLLFAMLRSFAGIDRSLDTLVADPEYLAQFDRLCLVAGAHGSPLLQGKLKRAAQAAWFRALELDEGELGLDSRLAIEFAFGGLMALLAYRADNLPSMTRQDLFDTRFARRLRRVLPSLLLESFAKDGAIGSPLRLRRRLAATALHGDACESKPAESNARDARLPGSGAQAQTPPSGTGAAPDASNVENLPRRTARRKAGL